MAQDSDHFRRAAAEARSVAFHKDDSEDVEVAGQLALAYAALARRRAAPAAEVAAEPVDAIAASVADPVPLILRD